MVPPKLTFVPHRQSGPEPEEARQRRRQRRARGRERARCWRTRAGAGCRPTSASCPPPTGASSCASWRRCCLPPPSRWPSSICARTWDPSDDVAALLEELKGFYASRGINLVKVAGKWAFRTAEDLSYLLERHATEQRRLSKAAMETLAIIAYHQPVTRAEIEEIRGVVASAGTLDVLMEIGWVRPRGRRRAPGRPITYGTTEQFLDHFGLDAIKDLPGPRRAQGQRPARQQPAARLHRARAHRRRRPDARRAAAGCRRRAARSRCRRWATATTTADRAERPGRVPRTAFAPGDRLRDAQKAPLRRQRRRLFANMFGWS